MGKICGMEKEAAFSFCSPPLSRIPQIFPTCFTSISPRQAKRLMFKFKREGGKKEELGRSWRREKRGFDHGNSTYYTVCVVLHTIQRRGFLPSFQLRRGLPLLQICSLCIADSSCSERREERGQHVKELAFFSGVKKMNSKLSIINLSLITLKFFLLRKPLSCLAK